MACFIDFSQVRTEYRSLLDCTEEDQTRLLREKKLFTELNKKAKEETAQEEKKMNNYLKNCPEKVMLVLMFVNYLKHVCQCVIEWWHGHNVNLWHCFRQVNTSQHDIRQGLNDLASDYKAMEQKFSKVCRC